MWSDVTARSERLEFCAQTCVAAGERIRAARERASVDFRYKRGVELVTEIDEEVDRFIRRAIRARFPGERIHSEEGNEPPTEYLAIPALWVVDPLDGTVNFTHRMDQVAVAIAYAEFGRVLAGVVYAPFLECLYSAQLGEGARKNGEPIRPSQVERIRHALIGTGFPHDRTTVPALMPRLARALEACQDVRRLGAPTLDICLVAEGRRDGFYEGDLAPWDVAAAGLIAREAGACWGTYGASSAEPVDLNGRNIVTATPGVFDELADLLGRA